MDNMEIFLSILGIVLGVGVTIGAARIAYKQAELAETSLRGIAERTTELRGLTETVKESTNTLSTATEVVKQRTDEIASLTKEAKDLQSSMVNNMVLINEEIQETVHGRHKPLESLGELIAYMFAVSHVLLTAECLYLVNFAFKFGHAHSVSTETKKAFCDALGKLSTRPEFKHSRVEEMYRDMQGDPERLFANAIDRIEDNLNARARRPHFGAALLCESKFNEGFLKPLGQERNDKYVGYSGLNAEAMRRAIMADEMTARKRAAEATTNFAESHIFEVPYIPIQFICGKLENDNEHFPSRLDGGDGRDRWLSLVFYVGSETLFNDRSDLPGDARDADYLYERPSDAIGVYTRSSRFSLICLHLYGWLKSQHYRSRDL